mgnify:CR=1 FL=1|jgi:hypothetical protein
MPTFFKKRECIRDLGIDIDDRISDKERRRKLGIEDWRGPHQDRTVNLMLAGLKPAALVSESNSDRRWLQPYIAMGRFHEQMIEETIWRGKQYYEASYVITAIGQEWRANKLAAIYREIRETGSMSGFDHARVGILLGYSNREIQHFLYEVA